MNPLATVVLALAAGGGAALLVDTLRTPPEPPATPSTTDGELAALRTALAAVQRDLDSLRTQAATAPASDGAPSERTALPTLTDEQIGAALARYLAAHGGKLPAEAAVTGEAPLDVDATFAKMRQEHLNFWENPELFKRLHAAGKMDEFIAMMEQHARANPKDAQAQMDLANSYLAYLQLDNTKWQLSMKADESFDRVLELDGNHWEARFSKAVSYSFWPDFLGKKKEAVAHFETLVAQQETMPAENHHAETYLYLGNLLEQRGDRERAREMWERGLRRHPNNAALREKLGQ